MKRKYIATQEWGSWRAHGYACFVQGFVSGREEAVSSNVSASVWMNGGLYDTDIVYEKGTGRWSGTWHSGQSYDDIVWEREERNVRAVIETGQWWIPREGPVILHTVVLSATGAWVVFGEYCRGCLAMVGCPKVMRQEEFMNAYVLPGRKEG